MAPCNVPCVWESCSRESQCILCLVMLNEEGVLYANVRARVDMCVHEPVGNPVNHYCVFSTCAPVCVCFISPWRLVLACSTTV